MAKLVTMCLAAFMLFALYSSVLAATITMNVQPADVPDETPPRVNAGDAPTGFGPDSWQGPATGKTNWHARYVADGDALSALFPVDAATLTIGDLAEISYFTKRPTGTPAGRDWWVQIYTRPTGSGDNSSWYHDRFINNYSAHTNIGAWTQYSTGGAMTFHSNGLGAIGESTLTELSATAGTQQIEMISIQTDSGWGGFDGYIDGLVIELANGNIGEVNLVPEPAGMSLLATGGLVLLRRRRRLVHGHVV